MTPTLLTQGAEAKIYLVKPRDTKPTQSQTATKSPNKIIDAKHQQFIRKDRTPKSYRHPTLDKQIRTRRTKSESKILSKALAAGINVPKVLNTAKFDIEIEYIDGDKLSERLNSYPEEKQFRIMKQLGKQTALLHKKNIIHGDLTTSNVILNSAEPYGIETKKSTKSRESAKGGASRPEDNQTEGSVYIIDFGLGFISSKQEDKAVDLHLIKQALEAKHFQNWKDLFENFKKGYKWKDSNKILERLKIVEKRGRYKH